MPSVVWEVYKRTKKLKKGGSERTRWTDKIRGAGKCNSHLEKEKQENVRALEAPFCPKIEEKRSFSVVFLKGPKENDSLSEGGGQKFCKPKGF